MKRTAKEIFNPSRVNYGQALPQVKSASPEFIANCDLECGGCSCHTGHAPCNHCFAHMILAEELCSLCGELDCSCEADRWE